jgi:hypothetical protein
MGGAVGAGQLPAVCARAGAEAAPLFTLHRLRRTDIPATLRVVE